MVTERFGISLAELMDPDNEDISSNSVSDHSPSMLRLEKDMLTEEHLKLITRRTAQALQFLHSANIVHRNICPEHILVNTAFDVRICGFSHARTLPKACVGKGSGNSRRMRSPLRRELAKTSGSQEAMDELIRKEIATQLESKHDQLANKPRSLSSHVGSRHYRSPELLLVQKQYDSATDIWSLGVTLAELVRGLYPKKNFPWIYDQIDFFSLKDKVEMDDLPLFRGTSHVPLSPRK